ncbi:MAG TPA: hypothetical protein PK052_02555 [Anaerohalosphaeraceae bacterium]|nr:hypothetical protein [Anaerohalosphaeraceae bacterium]HOL30837.1 hypothetical protein [Anaerohalosphaeraceae bacterium]HOM75806.1 hypothetical protein [Anaerohalosphaeraceae bacterium]HPC64557.1 hypothetical protein [Anaerohalosphaeraceae bacterium]HPO69195.1 hypothetical protein [Anaerohalosphaeraceae bacterium]
MMFSIDLLKGKGLPEKTDLKRIGLKAVPLLIPILAVGGLAASWQHSKALLESQKAALQTHQEQMALYAEDAAAYSKTLAQINSLQGCLKDISAALAYRIQVSDLLVELVQTLPDSIFLYEMKLDRNSVVEKIQQADSADAKQRLVVRRKLNLILCGFDAQRSDPAVQEYLDRLKQSARLRSVFEQIKPTARQQGQVDNRNAVYYEIECVLKEQG